MKSAMGRFRIVLAGVAVIIGLTGILAAAHSAAPKEKIIKITAKRFDFTPGEIKLKKGVPVILELRTADVTMGFNAPDLGVRADIIPGKVTRLRVVPQKTGTFVFLCDIFCGTGHEDMSGRVTVVD